MPEAPRILVSEARGFSPRAAELLGRAGSLALADLDRKGLLAAAAEADVLWVRLRHLVDRELFDAAPRLRVLVTPTTGLNHVDLGEAERRGVAVLSLRGETAFLRDVRATAEHTIALTLALLRKLPAASAHVAAGGWNRDLFRGRELCGKTFGIVGYGRLGRIVGRLAAAFDARVLASDPAVTSAALEPDVELVPLPRLLAESEIVSLHVALTEATRGFFGAPQIAAMRPGALLVNTSRGELLDEEALLAALASSRLAGAALDVLCDERAGGMGDRPLVAWARAHENVIVTPHIGGCTEESMEKTELFLAQRLLDRLVPVGSERGAA